MSTDVEWEIRNLRDIESLVNLNTLTHTHTHILTHSHTYMLHFQDVDTVYKQLVQE